MRTVPSAVGHLKAADTADRQGDDAVREEEKKLQKTLDAFYMDGAAYLGKYIGMNASKKAGCRMSLMRQDLR